MFNDFRDIKLKVIPKVVKFGKFQIWPIIAQFIFKKYVLEKNVKKTNNPLETPVLYEILWEKGQYA